MHLVKSNAAAYSEIF